MAFDVEREIAELKGRVETIEGILQKCPNGQHWDSIAGRCVDDQPMPQIPQQLKLMGAAGSLADGINVAGNVIDGRTTTRFSSQGPGAWLCIDLGGVQEIHSIQFTWFNQANENRRNTVGIDFFDQAWPTPPVAAPSISHTNTSDVSRVEFAARKARAIMIRLMSTTHTGNWFSVIDVKVTGMQLVAPTAPPPAPVPPVPPQPQPAPAVQTTDAWGFSLLYERTKVGNSWEFSGNASDPRFFESKIRFVSGQSGKNGWLTTDNLKQLRLGILPVAGLKHTDIQTYHIGKVHDRGGFLNKKRDSSDNKGDWGDFEMTWAIRNWVPGKDGYESHIECVVAGFRSSHANFDKVGKDKAVTLPCQSMALHWNIYPPPGTNRVKFEKNTYHNTGYTVESSNPKKSNALSFVDSKKGFVMKAVFYRVKDSKVWGGFATKLETWISTDGLTGKKYRKVLEYLDNGKWGPTKTAGRGKLCGAKDDYPVMSMDKCNPHYRMDFAKSIEFSRMSIRSIDPTKPLIKSS